MSATIGAMPDEWSVDPNSWGKPSTHRAGERDTELVRLAEEQHGVVARTQLLAMGTRPHVIEYRLARGRLHALHRGVYAVGHRVVSVRGRWMAAVLAHGDSAALSHRSAGSLWGLLRTARSKIEVTADRRWPRPGVQRYRSRLPADERTLRDRIPVTTIPRTLLDLATCLDPSAVARAVERAEATRMTDSLSLLDLLERYPRRPGAPILRALIAEGRVGEGVTRSELEDRFIAFLEAHGLPRPRVNVGIEVGGQWMECDCVWRAHRLVVELDGRATHDTAAAFERDRARDRALQAGGWRVVRVTWRQLHADEDRVATDLHGLLGV